MVPELDEDLGRAYAGALLAIARVDGDVVIDEILRIRAIAVRRLGRALDESILFGDNITPDGLAAAASRQHGDPFRSAGIAPRQLGRMLIEDGLSLALADGGASRAELALLTNFARALGCTADDLADLRARLPAWLPLPR